MADDLIDQDVKSLRRRGLGLAAVVRVADQVSKWWILEHVMRPPRVIEILPFFNLVLAWNRGVSFGLFSSGSAVGPWVLSGLALVISVGLAVWLFRVRDKWPAVGIGLIIGGAVGNVVDRARFGAVADFLDVHAFGYHWPAFNVADSAITLGAAALILDSLFRPDKSS